jgi:hypothetical protein
LAPSPLPSRATLLLTSLRKRRAIDGAEATSSLPSHAPPPLSSSTSRGGLTKPRRHHRYHLACHSHCYRHTSKVRPTMPRCCGQRCHRHHCRRSRASKGRSTMSRRHSRYPPVRCCRRHHCTSRIQPMAPRRRCYPRVSKGQLTNLRRHVIIPRAGGNQQRRGAIQQPLLSSRKQGTTNKAEAPPSTLPLLA